MEVVACTSATFLLVVLLNDARPIPPGGLPALFIYDRNRKTSERLTRNARATDWCNSEGDGVRMVGGMLGIPGDAVVLRRALVGCVA